MTPSDIPKSSSSAILHSPLGDAYHNYQDSRLWVFIVCTSPLFKGGVDKFFWEPERGGGKKILLEREGYLERGVPLERGGLTFFSSKLWIILGIN